MIYYFPQEVLVTTNMCKMNGGTFKKIKIFKDVGHTVDVKTDY